MDWTFKPGLPIYTQIVEKIRLLIANGTYEPGAKLPSVRDLAVEASVNPNTVQRALAELEREGLLHTERTNGRFVTEEDNALKDLKQELGETIIREMFVNLRKLNMSNEEIVAAVNKWIDGGDNNESA